jgi:hypothetical protein
MNVAISWDDVQRKVSQYAVWSSHVVFSGFVGHMAGHTINICDRWLHPVKAALGKPPLVSPFYGAICGAVFAGVDRLANELFRRYMPAHIIDRPITHTARVIVSILLTTIVTSAFLPISMSMATVLITTNVLATTLLVSIANYYTHLVYQGGALPQEEKKQKEVHEPVSERLFDVKPRPQPEALRA